MIYWTICPHVCLTPTPLDLLSRLCSIQNIYIINASGYIAYTCDNDTHTLECAFRRNRIGYSSTSMSLDSWMHAIAYDVWDVEASNVRFASSKCAHTLVLVSHICIATWDAKIVLYRHFNAWMHRQRCLNLILFQHSMIIYVCFVRDTADALQPEACGIFFQFNSDTQAESEALEREDTSD